MVNDSSIRRQTTSSYDYSTIAQRRACPSSPRSLDSAAAAMKRGFGIPSVFDKEDEIDLSAKRQSIRRNYASRVYPTADEIAIMPTPVAAPVIDPASSIAVVVASLLAHHAWDTDLCWMFVAILSGLLIKAIDSAEIMM